MMYHIRNGANHGPKKAEVHYSCTTDRRRRAGCVDKNTRTISMLRSVLPSKELCSCDLTVEGVRMREVSTTPLGVKLTHNHPSSISISKLS